MMEWTYEAEYGQLALFKSLKEKKLKNFLVVLLKIVLIAGLIL